MVDQASRYRFDPVFVDDRATEQDERFIFLGARVPLAYRDDRDNTLHVVQTGDTLEILAERYLRFQDAADLWWVLAEFQQPPIADPTLRLVPGTILTIPSSRLVSQMLSTAPSSADQVD